MGISTIGNKEEHVLWQNYNILIRDIIIHFLQTSQLSSGVVSQGKYFWNICCLWLKKPIERKNIDNKSQHENQCKFLNGKNN